MQNKPPYIESMKHFYDHFALTDENDLKGGNVFLLVIGY